MKRAFLVAVAFATSFHLVDKRVAAQTPDDLKFFKNYFVVGDYVVRGVGLSGVVPDADGLANANISIPLDNDLDPLTPATGVPPGADILGAYLYWQVVSETGPNTGSVGAKFNGFDLSIPDTATSDAEPFGKALAFTGNASCFNPGGGTGDLPDGPRTFTYRLDVTRFLPTYDANSPYAGKLKVDGPHTVSIPSSAPNGNNPPIAIGASLFIMYRYPDRPEYANNSNVLNSIVIYDDGVTLGNTQNSLTQVIKGFYQPSSSPNATISYIVGSGQSAKREDVTLPDGVVKLDEFSGSELPQWDTRTYPLGLTGPAAESLTQVSTTIAVTNTRPGGRDCLTVAAMVFKTAVKDTDADGLLDIWERAGTTEGTTTYPPQYDPRGHMLPLLGKMGAKYNHKDMFIEIGSMDVAAQVDAPGGPGPWCAWTICDNPATPVFDDIEATDTTPDSVSYGGELKPPHSHRPGHETLKLVGDTFKTAPVSNPDATPGINVHFDVGTNYPACPSTGPCANPYIIGRHVDSGASQTAQVPNPNNPQGPPITVTLPTGGEQVDEMSTVCQRLAGEQPWVCQYGYAANESIDAAHPGTVGWKTGYRFIRDEVFSVTPTPPTNPPTPLEDYCEVPGYTCNSRFDRVRKDIFRYAFFAHALGIPKSPEIESPNFHIPVTNSGIGDFPGADVLLTLGAFVDYDNVSPTGTPFQQASTLVHESGHTLGRRHGGEALEPNCKPSYFSVMNYLYQLRGLVNGTTNLPTINLSGAVTPPLGLDEGTLADGSSGVSSIYRMSWFAPIAALQGKPGVTAALRHCDGTTKDPSEQFVRIDTFNFTNVDWDANSATTGGAQDINFNGDIDSGAFKLTGSNDWNKLALNQLGSRRSPGGYYYDESGQLSIGPLALGGGKGDLGSGDLSNYALGGGKGDLGGGKGDLGGGKGDLGGGKGDLGGGKGDLGVGQVLGGGKGDLGGGKGDLGGGDQGGGDLFGGAGEIDDALAIDLSIVPPNAVAACQLGVNCLGVSTPTNYVRVSWVAPTMAGIKWYTVYRAVLNNGVPGPWVKLAGTQGTVQVPAGPGQVNRQFVWIDPDSHRFVKDKTYAYQVTATYGVKDPVTGLPIDKESNASSPDALVGPIANANPTISAIAAQSIAANSTTVALPFTVRDQESEETIASTPKELSVSWTVSPPNSATVVIAGTGANRWARVQSTAFVGVVTVQLKVEDTQCTHASPPNPCTKGFATTTFSVTVNATVATFAPVSNIPPVAVTAGNPVVMTWRYQSGSQTVTSNKAVHVVTVARADGLLRTYRSTDPGTAFQYTSGSKTWQFTLPTGGTGPTSLPPGTYEVVIGPSAPPGYQASGPRLLVIN
jgi:hypothetical protein